MGSPVWPDSRRMLLGHTPNQTTAPANTPAHAATAPQLTPAHPRRQQPRGPKTTGRRCRITHSDRVVPQSHQIYRTGRRPTKTSTRYDSSYRCKATSKRRGPPTSTSETYATHDITVATAQPSATIQPDQYSATHTAPDAHSCYHSTRAINVTRRRGAPRSNS